MDGEGSGTDGSMETCLVQSGRGAVCVIAVVAEDLVNGLDEEEEFLAHELTHVLQFSGPSGGRAPRWLCEGMARWVQHDDEESRVEYLRPWALQLRKPRSPAGPPLAEALAGRSALEGQGEDLQAAGGAVIFFQLEWSRGIEAVRRLSLRLLDDPDWERVLREETGRPLDALFADARAGYEEWAARTFAGTEALVRFDRDRPAESVAAVEAFLAAHPSGPLRTCAEFAHARCLRLAGDKVGALAALRAFRRDHPHSSLGPGSLIEEIEILGDLGDWSGVAALCRLLLGDYLWCDARKDLRTDVEKRLEEARARVRAGAGAP